MTSQEKYNLRRAVKVKIVDALAALIWLREFPDYRDMIDTQAKVLFGDLVKESKPSKSSDWPSPDELEQLPDLDPRELED